MRTFTDLFNTFSLEDISCRIAQKTSTHVVHALTSKRRSLEDFMALVSPAAAPYLEQMAALSRDITRKRFGNTIQLYAPMYLSNECQNICTYCGFSLDNPMRRMTLTDTQIVREAKAIKAMGFEHVLLVTGESHKVGLEYFKNALRLIRPFFSQISMEVQPLTQDEYTTLIGEGLHSVLVYQETYNQTNYRQFHPKGKKSDFISRLETPDRLGKSGIQKTGIGFLIGLNDWRTEAFFTALHLSYLEKTYWKTRYSISFPRLRPYHTGKGNTHPQISGEAQAGEHYISDRQLVQLICAYRIFNENVELSLSTRESETFRNHVIRLGITTMSAGSKTNPGGYAAEPESLEQFEISDMRPPAEVASTIRACGYEAVWKDWDAGLG